MNYIVLDLEWNQPELTAEEVDPALILEIIEIGAVKTDADGKEKESFSELVKPEVYHSLNTVTKQLLHINMEDLSAGASFPEVMGRFLEWCGEEEFLFCTWGPSDLMVMQENLRYHGMEPLSDGPLKYLDLQKIYAYIYEEDTRQKRMLEMAVDHLGIRKDIPFHRAYDDACYTAKILRRMLLDGKEKFSYCSYEITYPPADRSREIRIQFDTYTKYISRVFQDKTEALHDREVVSSKCYLCHRNLKKKVKWFTVNHRHYYCLAFCEKHGYLKGKLRMFKADEGKVFVVKTTRLVPEEEALRIMKKREKAVMAHRRKKI